MYAELVAVAATSVAQGTKTNLLELEAHSCFYMQDCMLKNTYILEPEKMIVPKL